MAPFPNTRHSQAIHHYVVLPTVWTGMSWALRSGEQITAPPSLALTLCGDACCRPGPSVPVLSLRIQPGVLAKLGARLLPGLDPVTGNPWYRFPESPRSAAFSHTPAASPQEIPFGRRNPLACTWVSVTHWKPACWMRQLAAGSASLAPHLTAALAWPYFCWVFFPEEFSV